jgi:hypothetical protein
MLGFFLGVVEVDDDGEIRRKSGEDEEYETLALATAEIALLLWVGTTHTIIIIIRKIISKHFGKHAKISKFFFSFFR